MPLAALKQRIPHEMHGFVVSFKKSDFATNIADTELQSTPVTLLYSAMSF